MAGGARSFVLRVLVFALLLCEVKADVKPGFRVRITKAGLEYAREVVVDLLLKKISKLRIPVVHKKMGPFQVTLSGLKITSFPRPSSAVLILPGRGLRGEARDLKPVVQGNYVAITKIWKLKVHKSGTITAMGYNLAMAMDFRIGRDKSGRPTLSALSCRATRGSISLRFKGGWDTGLNLGSKMLRRKLYGIITSEICKEVRKEVEKYGLKKIKEIKMSREVGRGYMLDFSLTESPSLSTNGYVDLAHKGLIYMKDHMKVPPFPPPIIQEFPGLRQKMVYVFVTSYMANSAFYSTFRAGKLRINVTRDLLPVKYRRLLNTTCSTYVCAGTVFPQLSTAFPNAHVTADVFARKSPLVEIRGDTLLLTVFSETRAYVNPRDEKRKFIFSLQSTVVASVRLRLINNTFKFSLIRFRPRSEVTNSTIGNIGTSFFYTTMLRAGIQQFLVPKIVEFGSKGIVIPKVKYVSILNTELIKTPPNTPVLILGMDIRYNNRPA